MVKVKRIYKYGTGGVIPEGAKYLSTVTQTKIEVRDGVWIDCWLVWHYYMIETEENEV